MGSRVGHYHFCGFCLEGRFLNLLVLELWKLKTSEERF
jgi:hypothetical protein